LGRFLDSEKQLKYLIYIGGTEVRGGPVFPPKGARNVEADEQENPTH
jgi:hypothetical protein